MRERVLIVDDDPEWRQTISEMLAADYEVVTATSAAEAMTVVQDRRPDVVVLDVMMPGGMDGFRAFAEFGKDPLMRGVPVIFLSAVNRLMGVEFSPEQIRNQLGAEPVAFLEKPVKVRALLAAVRRALGEVPAD